MTNPKMYFIKLWARRISILAGHHLTLLPSLDLDFLSSPEGPFLPSFDHSGIINFGLLVNRGRTRILLIKLQGWTSCSGLKTSKKADYTFIHPFVGGSNPNSVYQFHDQYELVFCLQLIFSGGSGILIGGPWCNGGRLKCKNKSARLESKGENEFLSYALPANEILSLARNRSIYLDRMILNFLNQRYEPHRSFRHSGI